MTTFAPGASASTSTPKACWDSANSSAIWKRGSARSLLEISSSTWPSRGVEPGWAGNEISKRRPDDCACSDGITVTTVATRKQQRDRPNTTASWGRHVDSSWQGQGSSVTAGADLQ